MTRLPLVVGTKSVLLAAVVSTGLPIDVPSPLRITITLPVSSGSAINHSTVTRQQTPFSAPAAR